MTCVCGHDDDLHIENKDGVRLYCEACPCEEFCEDIDRDELEVE